MSLFAELKRRNVVRVSIAYVVAAWLVVQVGDVARESFEAPAWVMKMLITALIAGFPVVAFFAWAFEITPEGIKREKDVERGESITHDTAKKLDFVIIGLLLVAIVLVGLDRFVLERPAAPDTRAVSTSPDAETPAVTGGAGSAPTEGTANSIAVLPFVNMSNDPDQEFFSDGISEELLNLLAKVDGLTVASRTSSFAYKDSKSNIPDIARELKVANVLEGSVRKAGNQVRITAQLIDTTNDRHLWSESYDRDLDDIFRVQDEIATAIVAALRSELGIQLDAAEIDVTVDTRNMNAYELFLEGRELMIARRDLYRAVDLLKRAVTLDPEFARAWATYGAALYLVPGWHSMPEAEVDEFVLEATQATDRALDLDPAQSMAWAIKGELAMNAEPGPDWEASIEHLNRAVELDPGNATGWLWLGLQYSQLGYQDTARSHFERCLAVDPAYQNCVRHLAIATAIIGDIDTSNRLFAESARAGFGLVDSSFSSIFFGNDNMLAGILSANYLRNAYPGFPFDAWVDALEHPERDHLGSLPEVLAWFDNAAAPPVGALTHILVAIGAYDRLEMDPTTVNNWIWFPNFRKFRRSADFQRFIHDMKLPAYWEKHGLPPGCEKDGENYLCTVGAETRQEAS